MVAANARTAITFALSPGNAHDAPEGRQLLRDLGPLLGMSILMDRAYEGNETRQLVLDLEMIPVVPPKSNRLDPWLYDRALYKSEMKLNVSSAALKAIDASSPGLRSSTVSSSLFFPSFLSSRLFGSVNTP